MAYDTDKNANFFNSILESTYFYFEAEREDLIRSNSTPALVIEVQDDKDRCWALIYNSGSGSGSFVFTSVDCNSEMRIVCYYLFQTCSQSTASGILDSYFNPSASLAYAMQVQEVRKFVKKAFGKLNFSASYEAWMNNLWQSSMPCYDTINITASYVGERSLVKRCSWKDVRIPCSAVITKVATDSGFCCAFNAKAAEEMYNAKTYTNLIKKLQERDLKEAFESSSKVKSFSDGSEPRSQNGISKGLSIMLDLNSNLFSQGSASAPFKGFQGLITAKGVFPEVSERGFLIQPGLITNVALSATRIEAQESIRELDPWRRKCIFIDETKNLTLHKEYTLQNCKFECNHDYVRRKLLNTTNAGCLPWFYPNKDAIPRICNPWVTEDYVNMTRHVPDTECSHCLPTCTSTDYRYTITSAPFRKCSDLNVGVSTYCMFKGRSQITPKMWASQVLGEYGSNRPLKLQDLPSNRRSYSPSLIFPKQSKSNGADYDAYDEDIAVVNVFFETPVVFQFSSQMAQTWLDFMAAVGGLMGLCVGISIISVVELVYLCMQLCNRAARYSS